MQTWIRRIALLLLALSACILVSAWWVLRDSLPRLEGRAILPGFVNTHTHLAGALTKALTEDVPTFGGPFNIALGMHENIITFDDVYLPGIVHGIEMLKTGTTTINECWWQQPQSARIIEAVGLRGIVAAESPQQVGTHGGQQLVAVEAAAGLQRIDQVEPARRSIHHRHRRGMIELDHRRGRNPQGDH